MISDIRQSQKTVLDVSPSLTQNDLADGIVTKIKVSADICHAFACGVSGTDGDNHLGVQGLAVSPSPKRMPRISLRTGPLKISRNVMTSIEVNMVDIREVILIWDKCPGNKDMDAEVSGLGIDVSKSNSKISIFIGIWLEKLCGLLMGDFPPKSHEFCGSSEATDAPEARNLIETFVARHGEPNFAVHSVFPVLVKSSLPGDGVNTLYHNMEIAQCP